MQRFAQIFLTILLIVGLALVVFKAIGFKTIEHTFVFEDAQNRYHIREIAVVGDFSRWQKWYYLRRVGKRKWALTLPLSPGKHLYRFFINNRLWLKDPAVKEYEGPYSNSKIFVDPLPLPRLMHSRPPNGSWLFAKTDSLILIFDRPLQPLAKHLDFELNINSLAQTPIVFKNRLSVPFPQFAEGEQHATFILRKKSNQELIYKKQFIFFVNRQNQAPVAKAGFTQIVFLNQPVTLNGALSYDPDFEPLVRFRWRQTGGPKVVLKNAAQPFARFVPTQSGHYRFRLTVRDSMGLSSAHETDVWVLPVPKRKVEFVFKPDSVLQARKVALVGEFNNWQADKNLMRFDSTNGLWKIAIDLAPGVWEYKFVVNDQNWLPDAHNPEKVADGWNGFNSLKRVPPNHFLDGQFVQTLKSNREFLEITFQPDSQSGKAKFHWFADINNPKTALPVRKNRLRFKKSWPAGNYFYYLVPEKDGQWSKPQILLINHFKQTKWLDLRQTPSWADTSLFYEIFVRQFTPRGDLQGVIDRLPYLKALGVNVLWLMPVYDGPTDHGYAPTSLFKIEKDYGTLDDYRRLIEKAHQMGFKVIFDFVANHLSDQHRFVQAAAENQNSPLRAWFYWKPDGTWGYHNDWDTLVNLNYHSPWVRHYIINSALFWLNLGVDGFRCDVAWAVPHDFWKQFRRVIKQVNPQCLLLNEVLPRQRAFHDFEFDMSYDTDFYGNVLDVLHQRKPLSALPFGLEKSVTNYPRYSLALRYLENHDLPRFNTQFEPSTVKMMTQLLFTLPGTPLVYYGQEYFARAMRPQFFKIKNKKWFDFFQKGIKLRKQSDALKKGAFKNLNVDDQKGFWSFERLGKRDSVKVIVNLTKSVRKINIIRKATK